MTGKLSGDRIDFAFLQGGQQTHVAGIVDADRITATVTRGGVSTEYAGTRRLNGVTHATRIAHWPAT